MKPARGQGSLFDPPSAREQYAVALNPTVDPEDAPRLRAATQALRLLMGTEWRTATQLQEWAGRRYAARLHELSLAGIPHETRRVAKGRGEFEFRLIGTPTNGLM